MVRKDRNDNRPGSAHSETLERSDEVAENATAQGDGAPRADEVENNIDEGPDGAGALDSARREVAELRDRHLRLAAEFDNYRKRTAREGAQSSARAQADLVKQLLDPLDDLMRFADLEPSAVDVTTVVQGVDLVERKILKALGAAGLEVLNPVDEPFNPEMHEAVMTEPALSPEDDHTVSRVFQQGYMFAGQLLRPARVVVKQWNG